MPACKLAGIKEFGLEEQRIEPLDCLSGVPGLSPGGIAKINYQYNVTVSITVSKTVRLGSNPSTGAKIVWHLSDMNVPQIH